MERGCWTQGVGCPGSPVEVGGVAIFMHAPASSTGNRKCGYARDDKERSVGVRNNPTQAKRRLEWATHFLGVGSWVICPSTCRQASQAERFDYFASSYSSCQAI
jgi:hypothetical protein